MTGIDNNTLLYLRGDTFEDLSLNPKNITNNGVTIVEDGLFRSCFNFNGSSNYVNIDNMSFYDLDSFTIDFYLTLNNLNTRQTIFRQDSDTSGNRSDPSIHLSIELNKVLRFAIYNSSNTEQLFTYTYPDSTLIDTHIEISRKSNNLYLFINGKLVLNNVIRIGNIKDLSVPLALGRYGNYNGVFLNGKIYGFNIVNYCKHTEDFTPPTQPFNSITINKTNQTDTNIEFNIEKLGQETINKVEVLVNGIVSETYTDNYDNINYLIDKELINIGNNNIIIKVTYDDNYIEEKVVTYKHTIPSLPQGTSLFDILKRVKTLVNLKELEKEKLYNILLNKNVEVAEEDKMSDLVVKVNELNPNPEKLYLYKNGDEYIDTTGGFIVYKNNANTNPTGTFEKNDSYIELDATKGYASCGTYNKIDVSEFKTLYIDSITENSNAVCCFTTLQNLVTSNRVAVVETTNNKRGVVSVDISKLSTLYYLGIGLGTSKTKVYKIWLEK